MARPAGEAVWAQSASVSPGPPILDGLEVGLRGRESENNWSLAHELSGKLSMWPRSTLVRVF